MLDESAILCHIQAIPKRGASMGTLIQLIPRNSKPRPGTIVPDHDYKILGVCISCHEVVVEGEGTDYGEDAIHAKCLNKSNRDSKWRADQGVIFYGLAEPFALALGKGAVSSLVDPFYDESLDVTQAFTLLASLESLLNKSKVDERHRASAAKALTQAKERLRDHLRASK